MRAISFSDAVAMSIDEDDYIPKNPSPHHDGAGHIEVPPAGGVDAIPATEPPSQLLLFLATCIVM